MCHQSTNIDLKYQNNFSDDKQLDARNNNTKWKDANIFENAQLVEYDIFLDRGVFKGCKIPQGYQLIRVHTIYDVKHNV